MSHPTNPPPTYEEISMQGVRTQPPPVGGATYPVGVHSMPINTQTHQTQTVILQPQPQVILHVPVHQQSTRLVPVGTEVNVDPFQTICPSCNYSITTKTEIRPALQTHLCALCLMITGFLPCCLIPYCIPNCNNVNHYCPNCNAYIGTHTC